MNASRILVAQENDRSLTLTPSRPASQLFLYPHPWLWAVALVALAFNVGWIALSARISVGPRFVVLCVGSLLIAAALSALRKLAGDTFDSVLHRGWCLGMIVAVGGLLSQNAGVLNHLLMTLPFPLADERLMGWDAALGVDWLAYAKLVASRPLLASAVSFAYAQLSSYGPALILGVAVLANKQLRVLEISFLLVATAIVCLTCAAAFPAKAAFATQADDQLRRLVTQGGGDYHLEQLLALRGPGTVTLQSEALQGLATFPSFHTVLAIIVMWCSRGHVLASLAAVPSGLAILAATPLYGGHYFIDIAAGAVVALGFIWVWERWLGPDARHFVVIAMPEDPRRIGPKRAEAATRADRA